jgi:multicomponent Na+:H+ antiporter subunit B
MAGSAPLTAQAAPESLPDMVAGGDISAWLASDFGIAFVNVGLVSFLVAITIAIIRMRNLFAIVMLSGVYSLVSATWFTAMDAVDVAFTEASVGAGISTALMLGAMLLTARSAKKSTGVRQWAPLVVVIATGAVLVYASFDLPPYGDPYSVANLYVGLQYLERTGPELSMPNVVTATLASYRGFDTLGETCVILAAGIAVALLLGFGERALFNGDKASPKPPRKGTAYGEPSAPTEGKVNAETKANAKPNLTGGAA